MAVDLGAVLRTAQAGFNAAEAQAAAERVRQLREVRVQQRTGTGNIAETFLLDRKFRLVFVRCHYAGTTGTAAMKISLDSGAGTAYDCLLQTIAQAGKDKDVTFRITEVELAEPSGWTFLAGDAIRIDWTNPDPGNITWGLEVGLALAS